MVVKIGNKVIDQNSPTLIVAELSANHKQDKNIAKKTIQAMKKAGADAVKLQTYKPETITLNHRSKHFLIEGGLWNGKNLYDLYQEGFTPWEWHQELMEYAQSLGLIFFSTPFDKTAVDFLEQINVPAYKIASFEINDLPLIEYTASKGKPIIISTGIATLKDIKAAVQSCHKMDNHQVIILKCTSEYPTPLEDVNLQAIPLLQKKLKTLVGISDHTVTDFVPSLAVALGAKVIEKHFTLDKKALDGAFSLTPDEFKQMVEIVRNTEKALGKADLNLTTGMKSSRKHGRSLFAAAEIKKGETITEENIRSVRPNVGLSPKYLPAIIGKKANRLIKFGEPIRWAMINK